jgi:hypothetical protein
LRNISLIITKPADNIFDQLYKKSRDYITDNVPAYVDRHVSHPICDAIVGQVAGVVKNNLLNIDKL